MPVRNCNAAAQMRRHPERTVNFMNSKLVLGDVAFLGFAYELFSEIGMRINKMSSIGHVLSVVCTNGTYGYFPTEDQLCLGGYAIRMFQTRNLQPFAENSDYNLITESLKNLQQL